METFANTSEIYAEHSYSKEQVIIKNKPYSEEYSLIVSSEDDSVLSSDADVDNFSFKMDLSAQEDFKDISERSDLTPLDDEIKIEIEENFDFIKQELLDSYATDDDVDVMEDDLHGCTLKTNSLVRNVESNDDKITKEHEVELELSIKDDYIKHNDLNETVQIKEEQDEAPSINFNGNQNLEGNTPDLHSELIINDVKPTINKSEAYVLDYKRQNKEGKPPMHFYKCNQCNLLIENQKRFFSHIQKCVNVANSSSDNTEAGLFDETAENNSQPLYKCTKCNIGFMSKQALTMHSVCQRTVVTDVIDVGTENELSNSASGLSMENELKNFMNKAFYKCEHCNYSSRSKFHLKRHSLMHKGVRPFQCDCGYSTVDLSNFKRHIRIHTQERPFKCKKCPYRATEGQQVKTHYMAKHTDLRPFKCDLCDFKSVTRQALQNHSAKHGKKCMPQPSYKCYRCNFRSHSFQLVKAHIDTHSKNYNCIAVTSQDDGDNSVICTVKTLQCATCSYRTVDKEAVHEHIAAHSNKLLRCSECSYQASYDVHIAKHAEEII